jgi:hypothetical protein
MKPYVPQATLHIKSFVLLYTSTIVQLYGMMVFLLRRGFNELYMTLTVSNRCVEDAQAETGKAGSETSARSRSKKC